MSLQIKIIWILSLVSVLLLIGVQGYWLVNQYEYVLNSYSGEIALQALEAGQEEYLIRKEKSASSMVYLMNQSNVASSKKNNVVIGALPSELVNADDSIKLSVAKTMFLTSRQARSIADHPQIIPDDIDIDTTQFYLSIETNLAGDDLRMAGERAITNRTNPFDLARFDSILATRLQMSDYTIVPWEEDDSYDNYAIWKRTGALFNPHLKISYAFSPLENLGVFIHLKLPTQPVLSRMGIQLIVSVGITLLLIICLIFQVRTILKQKIINEIREDFVKTMVHELKRPVQTLKTFVSFLKDKKMRSDEEATEQVVRDSMFELDNLTAYLNILKDMLRIDNEKTSLRPVCFNLHELVEKVIRLTHIPPGKEVTFIRNFSITPAYETDRLNTDRLYMEADPIHFANVLSNLIENAIKYSSVKVTIDIKIAQDKRKIYISVKDNGIGIPTVEQDKVFTKFYRANNIPDKSIPGIGLGLSYVKLITEAHQGTVSLKSQVGEGTTVTISIPVRP